MDIHLHYLFRAMSRINVKSPKILENNAYYYRNRIIDCATRLFIEKEFEYSRVICHGETWDKHQWFETRKMPGKVTCKAQAKIKKAIKLKLKDNNDYLKRTIFINHEAAINKFKYSKGIVL